MQTHEEKLRAESGKDSVSVGIDYKQKRGMLGDTKHPTSFCILANEQKCILLFQNPRVHCVNIARIAGFIWRSFSGEQKLVYDAVAHRARSNT